MAHYESARTITVEAGTAIEPYRFLVLASDGQVDHAGTAQVAVDGVSAEEQDTVGRDLPMAVPDGGVVKVEAGAAVTAGAMVATDNQGRAIAWVDAAGNVAVGKAMSAAGQAGDIISVQFVHKQTGAGT